MRITILGLLTLSALAFAANPKQLAMPVGQTTTLSMPAPISKVTVENPALVEVSRRGRQIMIVGLSTGSTDVTVITADGELHLKVYVAADKYGLPQ